MWDMTDNLKRDFRYASVVLAFISALATVNCYLTGYAGFEAYLFAGLGFMCCIMQPRIWAYVINHWTSLGSLAVIIGLGAGMLTSWVDLTSNFQTIASARGINVQSGEIATTNYEHAQEAVVQNEVLVKNHKIRLSEMRNSYPWLSSETAASLSATIANMEGDHIYKRSIECTNVTLPSSRKYCDALTKHRTKLGIVQERDKLTAELKAAQAKVDSQRIVATTTEPGTSRAYMQAHSLVALLSWDGSEVSEVSRQNLHNVINLGLAIALWLLPPALAVFGYSGGATPGGTTGRPIQTAARPPADTSPTPSLPPHDGGGGPGQEVDLPAIEAPEKVAQLIPAGERAIKKVAAKIHELRPRAQEQTPAFLALQPGRRIVRVRDTNFSLKVARLTEQYKANKLCQA